MKLTSVDSHWISVNPSAEQNLGNNAVTSRTTFHRINANSLLIANVPPGIFMLLHDERVERININLSERAGQLADAIRLDSAAKVSRTLHSV
jgi:hypothetical protein